MAGLLGCLVALTLVPSMILSLTPGIPARIAEGALMLAILTVPAAVAVAVLKYRLYDLDIVVRKTVVAALVAGAFTAVYAIVVVAVGAVTGRPGSSPLTFAAAALAAVLLQPVRARAGLLADRLVYGKRATPYEVLSEFSGQMAGAYSVEDVLPRLAAIIGQATGAERAEVWIRTGATEQLAAAWPAQALSAPPPGEPAAAPAPGPLAAPLPVTQAPSAPALTAAPEPDRAKNGRARVFEVEHQGERLGSLRVTSAPREPLTPAGERLVQAVAGQAGLILRNVGLVEDLRASRQRLVAAADQARRDLERDLHDGAQQQIVALMAKLRLARNQLARDPAVAGQTLAEAQAEAQQTLQDLRELARGIHPSVLSDQGILAAVKSRITRLPIGVRLTAGPELAGARYPDDIEGAAYFLVCEALVNVLKHAHASQAQVMLSDDGATLRVEIIDDGAGFDPGRRGRLRAHRADRPDRGRGGSLSIRSRPGVGHPAGRRAAGPGAEAGRCLITPLRVVIAEDNYLVREGTRRLLEDGGGIDVVAAVGTADELLDAVGRLRPGVVITDIRMPPGHHMEGIAAAHAIRAGHPGTGVVVLSQHADDAYAFELFKNGTAGLAYLLKDRIGDLDELRAALTAVASGGSSIDPVVVEALVSSRTRLADSALRWLTPRELDVLREMARGRANPGIAAALVLSESAVEKHVSSIFAKLGLGPEPAQDRRVTAVLTFLRDSPAQLD